MTDDTEAPQSTPATVKGEFIKAQFEQTLETFRALYAILIQILTVMVVADATVVGYAITTQISGILFIGTLFPLVMLYIIIRTYKLMLPIAYTAVSLEHRYGGHGADWLASTFLGLTISPEYVATLKTISSMPNYAERFERLRHTREPALGTATGLTRLALYAIGLGHIIAPVILSLLFHWRLF